jgi:hypothetical protein
MVRGMTTFRRHFAGVEDSFVLIGGAACDEWFTRMGGKFRATKDIDMVLLLEAARPDFYAHLWAFIEAGGYEVGRRMDGRHTFFRFLNPGSSDYPVMIELLSHAPEKGLPWTDQTIFRIPAGEDVASLSAILVDPDYYGFIIDQRDVIDGLPLIRPAGLILLKIRAWLDLTRRQTTGDKTIKGSDIEKHRNDVFRLSTLLPVGVTISLPPALDEDLRSFLATFDEASNLWFSIRQSLQSSGIRMTVPDLLGAIAMFYRVSPG